MVWSSPNPLLDYHIVSGEVHTASSPPSHQAVANPDVGAAIRDREGGLRPLATSSPLIHRQVITYGIDVPQSGEYIAGEHHGAE